MSQQGLMVSASGVRAPYSDDFRNIAYNIARAYAQRVRKEIWGRNIRSFVVGCDAEEVSQRVLSAVISGLIAEGFDPTNYGKTTTPFIVWEATRRGYGAMMITASHNQGTKSEVWTGIKIYEPTGLIVSGETMGSIVDVALTLQTPTFNEEKGERGNFQKAVNIYLNWIQTLFFYGQKIGLEGVKIAYFGYKTVENDPLFLFLNERTGAEVKLFVLKDQPTEPTYETTKEMRDRVEKDQYCLGITRDRDGDRAYFVLPGVSDKHTITEEHVLPIFAHAIKQRNLETTFYRRVVVVTTEATSPLMSQIQDKDPLYIVQVGERNVAEKIIDIMKREDRTLAIGGEGNGGVIHPSISYARDATVATAALLYLFKRGELIAFLEGLQPVYSEKKKIDRPLSHEEIKNVKTALERDGKGRIILEHDNGFLMEVAGNQLNIRRSNTEPITRVIVHGFAQDSVKEFADAVCEVISKELTST